MLNFINNKLFALSSALITICGLIPNQICSGGDAKDMVSEAETAKASPSVFYVDSECYGLQQLLINRYKACRKKYARGLIDFNIRGAFFRAVLKTALNRTQEFRCAGLVFAEKADGSRVPVEYLEFKDSVQGGTTDFYIGPSGSPLVGITVNGTPLPTKCLDDSRAISKELLPVYTRCEATLMTRRDDRILNTPKWFSCSYAILRKIMSYREKNIDRMYEDLERRLKFLAFNQSTENVFDNLDPIEREALEAHILRYF